MNYINEKEFKKQPEKIQKFLKEWWKPTYGDLVDINNLGSVNRLIVGFQKGLIMVSLYGSTPQLCTKDMLIPLFREGQLRKFIEEKGNCIIDNISYFQGLKSYKIDLLIKPHNGYTWTRIYFSDLGNDLIKAYWKVACRIAEEESK